MQCCAGFAQKAVGDLDQNTRTIAGQRIGANSPPVGQILQNLKPLPDYGMTLLTFDVRNKADTAGIMLIAGIIQALLFRKSPVTHV